MAANSTRSSSPISSGARASETTRKSCVAMNGAFHRSSKVKGLRRFEPLTPANSPSDFGRRSVAKEGITGDSFPCEEKENEENQNMKASGMDSPGKNGKNFMSPTISAASKFTPSPRKKPLVERNDPVRSSILLLDGKAMFFSSTHQDLEQKSKMGNHQNLDLEPNAAVSGEVSKAVSDSLPFSSKSSKRVTFSDVSSVISDSKQGPSLQNNDSCSCVSPSESEIEDDPSMPPYEPKTNYLSPRPRFLRYKPSPRIGILLNREKGLVPDTSMQLEDQLTSSESWLDSESSEDSQEDDLQEEESPLIALCEAGVEQMEPEVYNQGVSQRNADAPKNESGICDSLEIVPTPNSEVSIETSKQNKEKKSWAISKLMCFLMPLSLFLAGVSVSITYPSMVEIAIEESRFPDIGILSQQSRIAAARAKNEFLWFISNIYKPADELGKPGETVQQQYRNISGPQGDIWNHEFKLKHGFNLEPPTVDIEENTKADDVFEEGKSNNRIHLDQQMMMLETEVGAPDLLEESLESEFEQPELVEEIEDPALVPELHIVLETQVISDHTGSPELSETEIVASNSGLVTPDPALIHDLQIELETQGITGPLLELPQTEIDTPGSGLVTTDPALIPELQIELEAQATTRDMDTLDVMETAIATLDPQSLMELESGQTSHGITTQSKEHPLPRLSFLGVTSVLALLTVVALFTYQYKGISILVAAAQTLYRSTRISNYGEIRTRREKAESEYCIDATPCPSEMSSFQKTPAYNKETEAQSSERRRAKHHPSKRESLVASSSAISASSPSYGSFTTFERIPIKSANGEEVIMTPVRRSSRIKQNLLNSLNDLTESPL